MKIKIKYCSTFIIFICFTACSINKNIITPPRGAKEFTTIHGSMIIDDPLTLQLINSKAMQRLKNISQYGTIEFLEKTKKPYDRFTHSLGVFYLLKKHGAPYKEQLAGLLHDISHTAFSHSTDVLYMGNLVSGAYQDYIHTQFLTCRGISLILNRYGFTAKEFDILENSFPALKQKHPELCADRIEYIIYAGHKEGTLDEQEVTQINNDLAYEDGTWFFKSETSAKKFASISLHETLNNWGGANAIFINHVSGELFSTAMREKVFSKEDLLFEKSDQEIWDLLQQCNKPNVKKILDKLKNYKAATSNIKKLCTKKYYSKFRGVDPWVKDNNGNMNRLSELDNSFKANYEKIKSITTNGWCLSLD